MSDHSSPVIFADVFKLLAKNPTDEHKAMARKLWSTHGQYDFAESDMGCDPALIRLGLARRRKDKYGDPSVQYATLNGRGWQSEGFEEESHD